MTFMIFRKLTWHVSWINWSPMFDFFFFSRNYFSIGYKYLSNLPLCLPPPPFLFSYHFHGHFPPPPLIPPPLPPSYLKFTWRWVWRLYRILPPHSWVTSREVPLDDGAIPHIMYTTFGSACIRFPHTWPWLLTPIFFKACWRPGVGACFGNYFKRMRMRKRRWKGFGSHMQTPAAARPVPSAAPWCCQAKWFWVEVI